MIRFANLFPDIVFSVSVGNEATVEWTDHMVPVESLVDYVRRIKKTVRQPVTFCENYVPWTEKLEPLAEVLKGLANPRFVAFERDLVYSRLAALTLGAKVASFAVTLGAAVLYYRRALALKKIPSAGSDP